MTYRKTFVALAAVAALAAAPAVASAQGRARGPARGHAAVRGHAVPRGSVRVVRPSIRVVRPTVRVVRPYYYAPYPYRSGLSLGFYYGYPGFYGYPYAPYAYGPYVPYAVAPYAYGPVVAARAYGGLRIDIPQRDAEVYADGYYLGRVDDFDGVFQQANLEPGPHRIEIRAPGFETIAFDVNIEPGRTITYRAAMRPLQP